MNNNMEVLPLTLNKSYQMLRICKHGKKASYNEWLPCLAQNYQKEQIKIMSLVST